MRPLGAWCHHPPAHRWRTHHEKILGIGRTRRSHRRLRKCCHKPHNVCSANAAVNTWKRLGRGCLAHCDQMIGREVSENSDELAARRQGRWASRCVSPAIFNMGVKHAVVFGGGVRTLSRSRSFDRHHRLLPRCATQLTLRHAGKQNTKSCPCNCVRVQKNDHTRAL